MRKVLPHSEKSYKKCCILLNIFCLKPIYYLYPTYGLLLHSSIFIHVFMKDMDESDGPLG